MPARRDGGSAVNGGMGSVMRWLSAPGVAPTAPHGALLEDFDEAELMFDTGAVSYLVLADRGAPYLLARVRWPDVAQAISAASPDWIDDPGLFDLPYDPGAIAVSFTQAAAIASGWGTRLGIDPVENAPSYIRRMPANWSDLTPSERRTWGIDLDAARPAPAALLERARLARAPAAAWLRGRTGASVNGSHPDRPVDDRGFESRAEPRVRLDGRAYIRCEHTTLSAGLVDLSPGGVRCVLPDAPRLVAPGARLGAPFLLEAEVEGSRLCLDIAGSISWHSSAGADTHFGVAFDDLGEDESEGVHTLLAVAGKRAHR